MEEIVTVPPVQQFVSYEVTGNERVHLPEIDRQSGACWALGVVSLRHDAVLEVRGDKELPLFSLFFEVEGEPVEPEWSWERQGQWIPSFAAEAGGVAWRGTWLTPFGESGVVLLLAAHALKEPRRIRCGLRANPQEVRRVVFSSQTLPLSCQRGSDNWTQTRLYRFSGELPLLTLAVRPASPVWEAELAPGEEQTWEAHIGVAPDTDGARTRAVHLDRRGGRAMLAHDLEQIEKRLEKIPRRLSPVLEERFERNLLFCVYYAFARTFDTDETVALTSRSSRYYVSGAFWERDTIYWALPALVLYDPAWAVEVVEYLFARPIRAAGEHAHYISGPTLYPGMELDQLAAYPLALEQVTRFVPELPEAPEIKRGLRKIAHSLRQLAHPKVALYRTFLLPSDDPARYPYTTTGNARAWMALRSLSRWGLVPEADADACQEAILRLLVDPERLQFVWSSDLEGNLRWYDELPGSLGTLAHLGLIDRESKRFQRTADWLFSSSNPFWLEEVPFPGLATKHHPTLPGGLGLAVALLAGKYRKVKVSLEEAPLDNGLMSESYDPQTGEARSGAAFATAAGYLATALVSVFTP